MELIVKILLILSLFFFTTATIGFLRFPDFYSRMHATGKGDTLGILLALLGLAIYHLEPVSYTHLTLPTTERV